MGGSVICERSSTVGVIRAVRGREGDIFDLTVAGVEQGSQHAVVGKCARKGDLASAVNIARLLSKSFIKTGLAARLDDQ